MFTESYAHEHWNILKRQVGISQLKTYAQLLVQTLLMGVVLRDK